MVLSIHQTSGRISSVFSNAKKPIGTNQGVNLGALHVVELLHGLENSRRLAGTNIAPENGWLENDPFPFGGWPIFRGYLYVSFRDSLCSK